MAWFRPSPDTFTVEELPAYLPAGVGEHTYLWIEKRWLTTLDAVSELARRLSIPAREIGYAGMKDRHATTRQWVSVPRIDPVVALAAGTADLRILRAERHGNKLRVGHLRGNRFVVTIGGLREASEATDLRARMAALVRDGLPNRYGDQRFGVTSGNVARGIAILRGEARERDHRRRRLLLSSVQSAVFNEVLAQRTAGQQLRRVLTGDILQKTDTGGVFASDDVEHDQARLDAGAVVITGPMPGGWAMEPAPGTAARAIEDQALACIGIAREPFATFGKELPGARRPLLVSVTDDDDRGRDPDRDDRARDRDHEDEDDDDDNDEQRRGQESLRAHAESAPGSLRLSFQLPAGTYATVLLAALGVTVERAVAPGGPTPPASDPTDLDAPATEPPAEAK